MDKHFESTVKKKTEFIKLLLYWILISENLKSQTVCSYWNFLRICQILVQLSWHMGFSLPTHLLLFYDNSIEHTIMDLFTCSTSAVTIQWRISKLHLRSIFLRVHAPFMYSQLSWVHSVLPFSLFLYWKNGYLRKRLNFLIWT